jgi:hypothetical protein
LGLRLIGPKELEMRSWKIPALLGIFLLGFIGAASAATRLEWRPLKFDLGLSAQTAAAAPEASSKVEITLFGGYASGIGLLTANGVASDLLTATASPWYGKGYTAFGWMGSGAPSALDADMAAPMLTKPGGALGGIKLGFNFSKTFQLELSFGYGLSGYAIDSAVWARFVDSMAKSISALQSYGRTVSDSDSSAQKDGKTMMAGIGLNLGIATSGPFMPYVSIGAGLMSMTSTPLISKTLIQEIGTSNATYGINITYDAKVALFLSGGLGFKYYIGPGSGLKLEVRGQMAMISLDKIVATSFVKSDDTWVDFTSYNKTALTEKGSPIFVTATLGYFWRF